MISSPMRDAVGSSVEYVRAESTPRRMPPVSPIPVTRSSVPQNTTTTTTTSINNSNSAQQQQHACIPPLRFNRITSSSTAATPYDISSISSGPYNSGHSNSATQRTRSEGAPSARTANTTASNSTTRQPQWMLDLANLKIAMREHNRISRELVRVSLSASNPSMPITAKAYESFSVSSTQLENMVQKLEHNLANDQVKRSNAVWKFKEDAQSANLTARNTYASLKSLEGQYVALRNERAHEAEYLLHHTRQTTQRVCSVLETHQNGPNEYLSVKHTLTALRDEAESKLQSHTRRMEQILPLACQAQSALENLTYTLLGVGGGNSTSSTAALEYAPLFQPSNSYYNNAAQRASTTTTSISEQQPQRLAPSTSYIGGNVMAAPSVNAYSNNIASNNRLVGKGHTPSSSSFVRSHSSGAAIRLGATRPAITNFNGKKSTTTTTTTTQSTASLPLADQHVSRDSASVPLTCVVPEKTVKVTYEGDGPMQMQKVVVCRSRSEPR